MFHNLLYFFYDSNYDNPCELLSTYETSGTCPVKLEAHGLPCTCPFNPSTINLPPSVFHMTHLNRAWSLLITVSMFFLNEKKSLLVYQQHLNFTCLVFQGRFRTRAEIIHARDIVGCFEVEFDIKVPSTSSILG